MEMVTGSTKDFPRNLSSYPSVQDKNTPFIPKYNA